MVLQEKSNALGIAASEAQVALADGDTTRAREQFVLAGDLLKAEAKSIRGSMKRNERLYLAACQYYHGGEYDRARRLCGHIQPRLLSIASRSSFDSFVRDVSERCQPGYADSIRDILSLHIHRDPDRILEILRKHPHVLPKEVMAFVRAMCCEELKDYRTAAIFFADTLSFGGQRLQPHFFAAGMVVNLQAQDQEGAWAYCKHLLELVPHPLVSSAASLICYHRAWDAPELEKSSLFRQQLELFEDAEAQALQLPPDTVAGDEVRFLIALSVQAAALTYARVDKLARAYELAELAVTLVPTNPDARAVRDLIISGQANAPLSADAAIQTQQRTIVESVTRRRNPLSLSA